VINIDPPGPPGRVCGAFFCGPTDLRLPAAAAGRRSPPASRERRTKVLPVLDLFWDGERGRRSGQEVASWAGVAGRSSSPHRLPVRARAIGGTSCHVPFGRLFRGVRHLHLVGGGRPLAGPDGRLPRAQYRRWPAQRGDDGNPVHHGAHLAVPGVGQRPPYADSTGSRTGAVLRDGRTWDIRWSRPKADGGTTFTTAGGQVMTFARGQVWVVLAPRP
jgi:Protein of unknown function (DUF3048) C-terminal domain